MVDIPSSTLLGLKQIPYEQPVALLLRHSVRPPIPSGQTGNELPLTEKGSELAFILGQHVKGRLQSLSTSPVRRCIETAECLRQGAKVDDLPIQQDSLLGDPGIFVKNPEIAWQTMQHLGIEQVITRLMNKDSQLLGFNNPISATEQFISHLQYPNKSGLHVFVTHDFLITPTVAIVLNITLPKTDWPDFLQGVFFFREDHQLIMLYKHYKQVALL
jgi:hypothetical protein